MKETYTKEEVLALLNRISKEVVGENETQKPWVSNAGGIRNILREEQRTQLNRIKQEEGLKHE